MDTSEINFTFYQRPKTVICSGAGLGTGKCITKNFSLPCWAAIWLPQLITRATHRHHFLFPFLRREVFHPPPRLICSPSPTGTTWVPIRGIQHGSHKVSPDFLLARPRIRCPRGAPAPNPTDNTPGPGHPSSLPRLNLLPQRALATPQADGVPTDGTQGGQTQGRDTCRPCEKTWGLVTREPWGISGTKGPGTPGWYKREGMGWSGPAPLSPWTPCPSAARSPLP